MLVAGLLVISSPAANAMSLSELKEKIKSWQPGSYISCEMVTSAYKYMSAAYIENKAKEKGATPEQIEAKKSECGLRSKG